MKRGRGEQQERSKGRGYDGKYSRGEVGEEEARQRE